MILFPGHKLYKCRECTGCFICLGGLASCVTCHGAEGSLPTHCPQRAMTAEECDDVQAGVLDFRDGEWHQGISNARTRGA